MRIVKVNRLAGVAALILAALCGAAAAQTANVGNENASTSAVIIEGGGPGHRTTSVRTNPDVAAPPVMTAPQSCYVGQGSVSLGSYLFGGISGSKTQLDEGCEARADSAHMANLAVTWATVFGDSERAVVMLDTATRRLWQTREQWEAQWADLDVEWEEFWRP